MNGERSEAGQLAGRGAERSYRRAAAQLRGAKPVLAGRTPAAAAEPEA